MTSEEIEILSEIAQHLCEDPTSYASILGQAAKEHSKSHDVCLGIAMMRNRLSQYHGGTGIKTLAAAAVNLQSYDGAIAITGRVLLWVLRRHLYRQTKNRQLTDLEIGMIYRVAQAISNLEKE